MTCLKDELAKMYEEIRNQSDDIRCLTNLVSELRGEAAEAQAQSVFPLTKGARAPLRGMLL